MISGMLATNLFTVMAMVILLVALKLHEKDNQNQLKETLDELEIVLDAISVCLLSTTAWYLAF